MGSIKFRQFIAAHPNLTKEEIEAERQRRIHHICTTQEEYNTLHQFSSSSLPGQSPLF